MSYSTHNVHEIVGINVEEVKNYGDIIDVLGNVVPFQTQTVTFCFKGGGTHEITAFYEPGAIAIEPREYSTKPAMTVFTEDSKVCQAQKESFANALPNPIIGEYNKDDYPKDYIV